MCDIGNMVGYDWRDNNANPNTNMGYIQDRLEKRGLYKATYVFSYLLLIL